jgi:hypothetical protein
MYNDNFVVLNAGSVVGTRSGLGSYVLCLLNFFKKTYLFPLGTLNY